MKNPNIYMAPPCGIGMNTQFRNLVHSYTNGPGFEGGSLRSLSMEGRKALFQGADKDVKFYEIYQKGGDELLFFWQNANF